MPEPRKFPPEADLEELFERVNNAGRWGPNDELGTLNYITERETRGRRVTRTHRSRAVDRARPEHHAIRQQPVTCPAHDVLSGARTDRSDR